MAYLIQNITHTSPILGPAGYVPISPVPGFVYGMELYVNDIPNVTRVKWYPGQIIDLEKIATVAQIEQSRHLKVHIAEGRMVKL